jgi:hypothetical protein
MGGGFGGGGFAGGHVGAGSAGGRVIAGRMGSDYSGRRGEVFLGNGGGSDFHGTRMGGDLYYRDHDHDRHHHFRERLVGVPRYYYDDYGYGLDDFAGDNACFQYRHVHTTSGWQWRQVWVCN